jgi:hypothetical protein
MKENVKKEDRASLSVSRATRERVMSYLTSLIGERGQLLTQDDAVKEMLDCVERERSRKRE